MTLTGSFVDTILVFAAGSQGTQSLKFPGAPETYADFVKLDKAISWAATEMLKVYIMHTCALILGGQISNLLTIFQTH